MAEAYGIKPHLSWPIKKSSRLHPHSTSIAGVAESLQFTYTPILNNEADTKIEEAVGSYLFHDQNIGPYALYSARHLILTTIRYIPFLSTAVHPCHHLANDTGIILTTA